LARDREFHTGDLEDPLLSIRYGVHYLGLLMQRFDGVYPLAVASYNGGPFSVSAWRRAVPDLPMDAFVELIPFRETRDYVKKVSAGYAAYVHLYGPEGAWVAVPPKAQGDHPEVVDF
jgi:soluble lytic murein transglycosylase